MSATVEYFQCYCGIRGCRTAADFNTKATSKAELYSPLRSHIAHLDYDKLILDLDDLHIHKSRDSASDESPHPLPPSDLLLVFPELPFAFAEPPPLAGSSHPQSAGKKGQKFETGTILIDAVIQLHKAS